MRKFLRIARLAICFTLAGGVLLAQQGTTILRDYNSNTQANVASNHALDVNMFSSTGTAIAPVTDPCDGVAKSKYVINTTSAATFEIDNASGSDKWYICSVNIIVQGAQKVAIAADNTDGCGSITEGLNGGTTAATGWSFAADGSGIALGASKGTVLGPSTGGYYLCMLTSTTAQTSGSIQYVHAP